jgi:Flp pilus assembly protein TadB
MHTRPEAITRALARVIRERWTAAKALQAMSDEAG